MLCHSLHKCISIQLSNVWELVRSDDGTARCVLLADPKMFWSVDRSNINVLTLLKATFLHIISSIFETFCNIFNVIHHDCDVTFCKFLVKRFDILLNYPWIVKNRVNKTRKTDILGKSMHCIQGPKMIISYVMSSPLDYCKLKQVVSSFMMST